MNKCKNTQILQYNLNIHKKKAFYETLSEGKAEQVLKKIELYNWSSGYIQEHGLLIQGLKLMLKRTIDRVNTAQRMHFYTCNGQNRIERSGFLPASGGVRY